MPRLALAAKLLAALLAALVFWPALARAQAEPAPEGYVPPGHTEPEAPPPSPIKWRIAADGRPSVALRSPQGIPTVGWGAGVQVTRALIDVGRLRVGVGADFGYERFGDVFFSEPDTSHHLAFMTFAGLLVLDAMLGRVRPYVAAGGGFAVAWYFQPDPHSMTPFANSNTVVGLVVLEAGLSVMVYKDVDIGVAGHFDLTFSSQSLGQPPFAVFSGGVFSPRIQIGFRF
ncbi:MAG TPA: hypothetical protein VN947_28740 [Polyangia bacterium]|nr:hypothetical protein [Polyangia bacterium]